MRHLDAAVIFALVCLFVGTAASADNRFDWDSWRSLSVQDGGRHKPLDTLARETLRAIAGRERLTDPATNKHLDPVEAYLTMVLAWQGWEHPDKDQLQLLIDWRPLYFHLQPGDQWDAAPLLPVDFPSLRAALGLDKNTSRISPRQLAAAKLEDRKTERMLPFSTWADKLLAAEEAGEPLNDLEKKGLQLANRLWLYQSHRMARGLEVLPLPDSEERKWMPAAQLLLTKIDKTSDPSGELRKLQELFVHARKAFLNRDAAAFNRASQQLIAGLRHYAAIAGDYPDARMINLEVAYNRWTPFRIGWILMLLAATSMWLFKYARFWPLYAGALAAYLMALGAVVIGFGLRITISGRAPVTNMYESVIYVGAGVGVLGLIFELVCRRRFILTAAASVTAVVLVLADNCPLTLDPAVRPLEPVLRSNFWLVTHVMMITLSYAAFALALGLGNITLGYYLTGSDSQSSIRSLGLFTYKALQVGVLLLSAGIILGGVWADYSWGRFWGWDPKEVWALVALLGYLAVLHARFAGWVGHRGLAALSVACFSLVVMAWYGVNFVLGAGLHSYGFGRGGQAYVVTAVVLQLLYVALALARSWRRDAHTTSEASAIQVWPAIIRDEFAAR